MGEKKSPTYTLDELAHAANSLGLEELFLTLIEKVDKIREGIPDNVIDMYEWRMQHQEG